MNTNSLIEQENKNCIICSQKNAEYTIKEKYVCDSCIRSLLIEKNNLSK